MLQAASAAYDANDWSTAERLCRRILAARGDHFEALNLLAIVLAQSQRLQEAATLLAGAVAARPEDATAQNNHGNVLRELRRPREALAAYDRALALDPHYAEACNNRGGALQALGESEAALASYERAIGLRPGYAEAHYSRGVVLQGLGRVHEALQSYRRALQLNPALAAAHYNCGIVLQQLRQLPQALLSYERALRISPAAATWNNRGNVLLELGRTDEALQSYETALRLDANLADAHQNRGIALQRLKRPEEVLHSLSRALELNPDLPWLYGTWLYARLQRCDWARLDDAVDELTRRIMQGRRASEPFVMLALSDAPALQRRAAEIRIAASLLTSGTAAAPPRRAAADIIRVGYYSADFRAHAMAQLMVGVFELHERRRFECHAFAFGAAPDDDMTRRLRTAFDGFHDVRDHSDREVAQLSRELEIDIAVDLMGFTDGWRTGIFAQRAAPVQVSYLGYPGTMAAPYLDYLIADHTVIPPHARPHYAESVIFLPHSYFPASYRCNAAAQTAAQRPVARAAHGLPQSGCVFCSFNSVYKLNPPTFNSWMRILQAVPHSVLWLLSEDAGAIAALRSQAERCGVDGGRLVFAPRLGLTEHLSRQAAADLFLDTLPCNAHTTASDALWMGLPVLTLPGETLAARVAASLLTALGLPELIAASREHYEQLAIELAGDRHRLISLRSRLAAQRLSTPLFDTQRLTRHLEAAYEEIYRRHAAGLAPQDVSVTAATPS